MFSTASSSFPTLGPEGKLSVAGTILSSGKGSISSEVTHRHTLSVAAYTTMKGAYVACMESTSYREVVNFLSILMGEKLLTFSIFKTALSVFVIVDENEITITVCICVLSVKVQ